MHVFTIFPTYSFGDLVRFNSRKGDATGKIFAITVDSQQSIDYLVEVDQGQYSDLEPGIVDADITGHLSQFKTSARHAITIASKYSFGEQIHFDSRNGKGTGIVSAIMLDWEKRISYVVKIEDGRYPDLQPGILENEVLGYGRR